MLSVSPDTSSAGPLLLRRAACLVDSSQLSREQHTLGTDPLVLCFEVAPLIVRANIGHTIWSRAVKVLLAPNITDRFGICHATYRDAGKNGHRGTSFQVARCGCRKKVRLRPVANKYV